MPLTNSQYESILRGYEEKQHRNHRLLTARREEVFQAIPEYLSLHQSVAELSAARGRLLLTDDTASIGTLKEQLQAIALQKEQLLIQHGFSKDYLEPIYSCPQCKDTGHIEGKKCKCFKQQMISLLYEQSNIRETLERENFSTLSYDYYEGESLVQFEKAVTICKNMVKDFDTDYVNLLLFGTVGTGKSFLSGCVAKELIETGHSVIYFSATALFETLARYSFDTKSKDSLYKTHEDLYNCDLVIIDDLGTELTNQFVASQLFSLLNERHIRQKATIISTNLTLEEIRERYSDRVFSRLVSHYNVCKLSGKDIRMQKKLMSNRK